MIKKLLFFTIIFTICVSYSSNFEQKITVNQLPLKYFFDGIEKNPQNGQNGFVVNGTTYVPLRFVAESLGEKVNWDGKNYSIYIGDYSMGNATYLEELKPLSTSSWGWKFGSVKSNVGEQFIHSLYSNDSWNNYLDITYALNGDFKEFNAKITPLEGWNKRGKSEVGEINFYVDDKLVHATGSFSSEILEPLSVKIDLTGALKFRVEVKANSYGKAPYRAYIGICDAKLTD